MTEWKSVEKDGPPQPLGEYGFCAVMWVINHHRPGEISFAIYSPKEKIWTPFPAKNGWNSFPLDVTHYVDAPDVPYCPLGL